MRPSFVSVILAVTVNNFFSQHIHAFSPQFLCVENKAEKRRSSSITATKNRNNVLQLSSSCLFALSAECPYDNCIEREHGLFRRFFDLFRCRIKSMSRRFRTCMLAITLFIAINCSMINPVFASGANTESHDGSDHYQHTVNKYSQQNQRQRYHNFHQLNGEQLNGEETVVVLTDGSINFVRKHNTLPISSYKGVIGTGFTTIALNGIVRKYLYRKKHPNDDRSGFSVWSLTASLDVPSNSQHTSIIQQLKKIQQSSSTEYRTRLQNLLAETSLELIAQADKGIIMSVESKYNHYRSSEQSQIRAIRHHNHISKVEKKKFSRLSLGDNKSNSRITKNDSKKEESLSLRSSISTVALVQIHLVMKGNTMKFFGRRQIETQQLLKDALIQLSKDLNNFDCLVVRMCMCVHPLVHFMKEQQQRLFLPLPFFSTLTIFLFFFCCFLCRMGKYYGKKQQRKIFLETIQRYGR